MRRGGGRRRRRALCRGLRLLRRFLRRLLRLAVGTELFPLRLGHDKGCALGMRCGACKLHRRDRSRGKQQETKFGHVILVPGINGSESAAINSYGLGRNVAVLAGGPRYILGKRGPGQEPVHDAFSDLFQIERQAAAATVSRGGRTRGDVSPRKRMSRSSRDSRRSPRRRGLPDRAVEPGDRQPSELIRRRIWRARTAWPAGRKFVWRVSRQFVRPRRRVRFAHWRRRFGLGIAGRVLQRRLGRMARGRRRNARRLRGRGAAHHIATLRLSPISGRVPLTTAAAILV